MMLRMPPRTLLVIALLCCVGVFGGIGAEALPKPEKSAVSKQGGYRLRLKQIEQKKSPWDAKISALSFRFDMESLRSEAWPRSSLEDNVYLEKEDPLVAAYLTPGTDVAKHKHFGWTSAPNEVVVADLEVGAPVEWLHRLELAVTVVRVTEWEELKFEQLGKGESDFLKCGPFQLKLTAAERRVGVSVASFSQFKHEQDEYGKRVPLNFLNHRFGLAHTGITDAAGRKLHQSGGMGTGGSSNGGFIIWPLERRTTSGWEGEIISYPISVVVRLPKQFTKERHTFDSKASPFPRPRSDSLVPRQVVRRFGDQLEHRAETAERLAPKPLRAADVQHLTVGLLDQPRTLREFSFELAFAPARVADERAHGGVPAIHALLGFFDAEVMPALHPLRFGMPGERCEDELIRPHWPAEKHRHARQGAELLVRQNVRDGACG